MNGIFLEGSQRAVILFHAYTGSTADVRLLGTILNRAGYTVYMPLFSGHGTQDLRNVLAQSPLQWQNDTCQAVDDLITRGYKQIAVFGLSMGGMMAIQLLTKKLPEIIGGGSFNSPVPLVDSKRVHQAFMYLAEKLYHIDMGDKSVYSTNIREKSIQQLDEICELSETLAGDLSKIEVPVYIAQSGKDELIDVAIGEKMKDNMLFTTVDYHFFQDATHVITIGQDKKIFNDSVLNFVNQLGWSEK